MDLRLIPRLNLKIKELALIKNKHVQDRKSYDLSFARIAWAHISELKKTEDRRIKTQIFGNLNHLMRVWSGDRAKLVSKKALELFKKEKPDQNPFDVRWEQRGILGNLAPRKPKIVWEHTVPVGQFIKEMASECNTQEEVISKMFTYPGACWITRDEDDSLNSNGYKNMRPGGFEKCYSDCGIEVISESELN